MDFGFSPEQEMLRATARKFLENECTSGFVRARMEEPAGVTDEFWAKLAEQGWLGLVYPEEHGGSGLGFVDLTVLMEEMGRVVMPGPFLSTVLLGGLAIREAGSPAQKKEWLARIAAGRARTTLAWTEPSARWDAAGITCAAREDKGGFVLNGMKLFVLDAHLADALVVVARTGEGKTPEDGVSLLLVPKGTRGMEVLRAGRRADGRQGPGMADARARRRARDGGALRRDVRRRPARARHDDGLREDPGGFR